mmetsp:Transcript_73420/g.138638  ORF Transcript_73420/g.138638 Transcript_73420/m.138638 type:complete len:85 (-) Transcript_73420:265-519(-)
MGAMVEAAFAVTFSITVLTAVAVIVTRTKVAGAHRSMFSLCFLLRLTPLRRQASLLLSSHLDSTRMLSKKPTASPLLRRVRWER